MEMAERAILRRQRIKTNRAHSFAEADLWDLQFWQDQSPEDRLSALAAIRKDVEKVENSREDRKA